MILAPSILSADLGHLADELKRAERGGAGLVHRDVRDGRFVPNSTMGPLVVQAASFSSAGEFGSAKEWVVRPGAAAVEVKEVASLGEEE